MNHDENELLAAWRVESFDIRSRVAAAIDGDPIHEELTAMRQELSQLRETMGFLLDELTQLRIETPGRSSGQLAPYSPTEGLIRLS